MKLRVSSSIAPFKKKAEKTWKLEEYKWPRDIFRPVVFFGMYNIADYLRYFSHLGWNCIIWAGSDITALKKSHFKKILTFWFSHIDNYVENQLEWNELADEGICADICPTFLEDVDDFPISFKPTDQPVVYISTRPGREGEYGLPLLKNLKHKCPEITFVQFAGNVPEDKFNEMIKTYHCGLRTNEHDGFSEIIAKSVLMGQYPISRLKYPHIDSYETEEQLVALLKDLKNKKEPNLKARDFWRGNVNNFPFLNEEE